jgi:hypothetical protein
VEAAGGAARDLFCHGASLSRDRDGSSCRRDSRDPAPGLHVKRLEPARPREKGNYKALVAVFGFSYDTSYLPGRENIGVLQSRRCLYHKAASNKPALIALMASHSLLHPSTAGHSPTNFPQAVAPVALDRVVPSAHVVRRVVSAGPALPLSGSMH